MTGYQLAGALVTLAAFVGSNSASYIWGRRVGKRRERERPLTHRSPRALRDWRG